MKPDDALAFIESLPKCRTSQEVGVAFASMIAPHGFLMASCGGTCETPSGRVWHFFFNTWPAEYLREYQVKDYVRHDLMPSLARLTATRLPRWASMPGVNLRRSMNSSTAPSL